MRFQRSGEGDIRLNQKVVTLQLGVSAVPLIIFDAESKLDRVKNLVGHRYQS